MKDKWKQHVAATMAKRGNGRFVAGAVGRRPCAHSGCTRFRHHRDGLCEVHHERRIKGQSLEAPIAHRGKKGEDSFRNGGLYVLRPDGVPAEMIRDKYGAVLKARIVWWKATGEIFNGAFIYVDGDHRNVSIVNLVPVRQKIATCVICKRGFVLPASRRRVTCPGCRRQNYR